MINRHLNRIICYTSLCLLLNSCVQLPEFKTEDSSLITSNYPIVAVNGIEIEKTYRLDLEAGENILIIIYDTYRYDYFCKFSWLAMAGTAYEVTDQENQYPLTLYRWHKRNGLWTTRLEPVDPLECSPKPK